MNRLLLCACMAGVFAVGTGLADEEACEEEWHEERDEERREVFDCNIRIDFKVVPQKEDDEGVYLITATPWYLTFVEYEGDETEINFGVEGRVEPMGENRFFISCEVYLEYAGEEERAEFNVETSALVIAGRETELASLGEKRLVVCVEYAEPSAEERDE